MSRTRTIQVRMFEGEFNTLEDLARLFGLSKSAMVRLAICKVSMDIKKAHGES